jgi:hypothetical protein
MDLTGILAVLFIFGGGSLILLSRTPIGQAIADRIRGLRPDATRDPAVLEELDRLRQEVTELQERMDFAERLLARQREPARVARGGPA